MYIGESTDVKEHASMIGLLTYTLYSYNPLLITLQAPCTLKHLCVCMCLLT